MTLKEYIDSKFTHGEDTDSMYDILCSHSTDHVIIAREGDNVVGVCLFLTLTDKSFAEVVESPETYVNASNIGRYLSENGSNLHFVLLATDTGFSVIHRALKGIVEQIKPKTVSWYDPNKVLRRWQMN
jgi:hypothetical protein